MPIQEIETVRQITLVLVDVAANLMAMQKILYDAQLATPQSFQEAYQEQHSQQLAIFRERILAGDAEGLRKVLQALTTTPHQA
ncbi:MAG: hypothetical protein ACRD4U_04130 [Candidatus Acidiferrales bacterium]